MYFKDFPTTLYDFDINAKKAEGTQATAIANLTAGGVGSVTITNPGSGYTSASVTFSEPENVGVTASAKAVVTNGVITNIIMLTNGVGYDLTPTVIITPPYGIIKKETKAFLMTDITRNIRFRRDILSQITVYDEYDIIDGETPEIIAEKVYGNAQYHWIVMLTNDIYDYKAEFPLTQLALDKFVQDKYGVDADAVHHYEDASGYIVNSDTAGAVSVSNRQYEELVNESKRRIKLISKDLIATVLKNFKDQL
jgi:hypothetical protein